MQNDDCMPRKRIIHCIYIILTLSAPSAVTTRRFRHAATADAEAVAVAVAVASAMLQIPLLLAVKPVRWS